MNFDEVDLSSEITPLDDVCLSAYVYQVSNRRATFAKGVLDCVEPQNKTGSAVICQRVVGKY